MTNLRCVRELTFQHPLYSIDISELARSQILMRMFRPFDSPDLMNFDFPIFLSFGEYPRSLDLSQASSRTDGSCCSSLFHDSLFQNLRFPCLQDLQNNESRYTDLASLSRSPPIALIVTMHPLEMNGPDMLLGLHDFNLKASF
jgi:hypothetical protein